MKQHWNPLENSSNSRFLLVSMILFLALQPFRAYANIGDFGYGSRGSALGGNSVAWGFDGFAAYANPAAVALPDGRDIAFSMGAVVLSPNFSSINQIVIDNEYVSDQTAPRTGNVAMDYRLINGQVVGGVLHLHPKWWNLSAGISAFTPSDPLGYIDTGETFVPEYVLYRGRNHRPQLELALGARPNDWFSFGMGVHIGFSLTTQATGFIATSGTKTSNMRLNASIRPKAVPYFGILVHPGATETETPKFSAGLVVRLTGDYTSTTAINTGVEVLTGVGAPNLLLSSTSSLFYDPLTIELGMSWKWRTDSRLYLQLDFQEWRAFKTPAMAPVGDSGQGIVISDARNPTFPTQNILVPRVGHEWELGLWTVRVGYFYRPSIFSALPTGIGNLLDPPKHSINLGGGYRFNRFLAWEVPCKIDAHFTFQQMVSQSIVKTSGNEVGTQSSSKIGAPGYTAGGRVYGGGLTLSLAI